MNSCSRCGTKLSHNYLVQIFMTLNDKIKKALVCLKCKEILSAKGAVAKPASVKPAVVNKAAEAAVAKDAVANDKNAKAVVANVSK